MTYNITRTITLALSLACLMLTACSLRPDHQQPTTYTLAPERGAERAPADKLGDSEAKLALMPVHAAPDLKSRRILIKRPGGITDYYADSRWSLVPAKLVRDFIEDSLIARFGPRVVSHGQRGSAAGYKLQLRLRDFQAEYTQSTNTPPVVRVAVTADMHAGDPDDEAARKRFEVMQKADANTMRDVRLAFEMALQKITDRMADQFLTDRL
mgnify:CR=1 FL=1